MSRQGGPGYYWLLTSQHIVIGMSSSMLASNSIIVVSFDSFLIDHRIETYDNGTKAKRDMNGDTSRQEILIKYLWLYICIPNVGMERYFI